jgi:hypothetical protein
VCLLHAVFTFLAGTGSCAASGPGPRFCCHYSTVCGGSAHDRGPVPAGTIGASAVGVVCGFVKEVGGPRALA